MKLNALPSQNRVCCSRETRYPTGYRKKTHLLNVTSEMRKASVVKCWKPPNRWRKHWIHSVLRYWQPLGQVTGFVFSNPHFRGGALLPFAEFSMNTNNTIKKYAPQARNQFRDAVIQELTTLGLPPVKKAIYTLPTPEIVSETVRYGQFDYPNSTLTRRDRLVKRAQPGADVLVEHCAYTWFNRLCRHSLYGNPRLPRPRLPYAIAPG